MNAGSWPESYLALSACVSSRDLDGAARIKTATTMKHVANRLKSFSFILVLVSILIFCGELGQLDCKWNLKLPERFQLFWWNSSKVRVCNVPKMIYFVEMTLQKKPSYRNFHFRFVNTTNWSLRETKDIRLCTCVKRFQFVKKQLFSFPISNRVRYEHFNQSD